MFYSSGTFDPLLECMLIVFEESPLLEANIGVTVTDVHDVSIYLTGPPVRGAFNKTGIDFSSILHYYSAGTGNTMLIPLRWCLSTYFHYACSKIS